MSRIKVERYCGFPFVQVYHKGRSFVHLNTEGKRIPKSATPFRRYEGKKGRFLEITMRTEVGNLTFVFNGTQINTLKRVLQEAGEVCVI